MLVIPLGIIVIEVIIYFRMFLYNGYIQWGNFAFPLKPDILNALKSLTWGLYYGGMPAETPWISLFGNLNSVSIILLGGLWNLNIAVKIYIFLSTFFMAYSFYLLIGYFSKSQIARGLSVIFILANPLSLQFIGQGDFFQFFIWGIYFLSLYFLFRSSRSISRKRRVYYFISVIFLSLTVSVPQIFYLGSVLYAIFIFYRHVIDREGLRLDGLKRFVKILISTIVLLVLLIMPLILTTIFGVFNLSSGSTLANPLNNFAAYSASFPNLLLMNSFPMLNTGVLLGSISTAFMLNFWSIIILVFVLVVFASGIIFMDKKMLFLELVIVLTALFGSGYSSPIASIDTYLYTHMFGYQVLNGSFYWEWIIIIPLYAIITGMLIDHLISMGSKSEIYTFEFTVTKKDTITSQKLEHKSRITLNMFPKQSRVATFIVLIVVILLVAPPLVGQGFYGGGNVGIHPTYIPENYSKLVQKLDYLVGNSSLGVAYFTPDNYVYFGNNTNGVSQPLLNDPGFRTSGIPGYLSPPVVSSNFFNWLYTEFYLNDTHYVAQLFSIMGIKYFVTLNGVISASSLYIANSENATKLMQYQRDVKLICSNPDYSLFESTFIVDIANSAQGFTLMWDNYNSLSGAAALGINISKIVPVFTEDLNSSNFNFFLNNTTSMILLNSSSLQTLAIDRYINSSDTIDPLSFTNNYYYSPYQGWMSSTGLETSNNNYILSDPYPFAITATNKSMSSKFIIGTEGNYTMFAQVLLSQPDSKIQFNIDGRSVTVDSNTVGFQWVRIPFNSVSANNNLSITSLNGLNGIQRIVILKTGLVRNEIGRISQLIHSRSIPVLYLSDSGYAQVSETGLYPIRIGLINTQNESTGIFQQLITIPTSYFKGEANANLSNLQWQYSNGSVIPSWMQEYNNTSATWWLKITNIPPFGHLGVFLTFYPKNSNELNAETTGESPSINPLYNDGNSVFKEFNSSGLISSGTGQYYPTNAGLFFYAKFYDPTGIPGNQALAGWNYDGGIDTPMFTALSNTSYVQPYYYVNHSFYLLPHVPDGQYYLFGEALDYPEAYWYINDMIIQTANSSSFVNYSGTYVRPNGVNVSVLYSFMTNLPPNNVMPAVYIQNTSESELIGDINNESTFQKRVEVVNNPNGYEVKNIASRLTIVRYGYFSGMKETANGFHVYPIMGDLIFVLVSEGNKNTADFFSVDYNLFLYGVTIYALGIAVPSIYMVLVFRKERKSGCKE
jgi:hypothetical protein